jgi:hypothetical protein
MESPATGSSSWTTTSGSTCGRVAMESPQFRLLLRNYAACRGAWGATNPRVASLRKELPHAADGGPEGTVAGVARWVGAKPRPRSGRAFVDEGESRRHKSAATISGHASPVSARIASTAVSIGLLLNTTARQLRRAGPGRPPEAARRAGLEFVEKLLTAMIWVVPSVAGLTRRLTGLVP